MNINTIISMISDAEIRSLLEQIVALLPGYWFSVPASSSGKYHPTFSLGEGGLVRHSIVVAYLARRNALAWGMTEWEQDVLTAAGLVHDGLKQGADGSEGHTVHEHPVLMANFIREHFAGEAAELMAHCIESHMGQWTTSKYSDVVLPAPTDKYQWALSAADMAAATKELAMAPDFFE